MKHFWLFVFAFTSIISIAKAQNDDNGNLLYPYNFAISTPTSDGKIAFDSNQLGVGISGSFGIVLTELFKPHFQGVETSVQFVVGGQVKKEAKLTFFEEDFIVDGQMYLISKLKSFSLSISTNGIDMNSARLVIKYRFYYDSNWNLIPGITQSGWLPEIAFGKPWFTHNKQYSFVDTFNPPITISGPTDICTEGVYEIQHAGNVVIQNIDGTPATLTKTGATTYKLSRVSNNVGIVRLMATSNTGNTANFDVRVGLIKGRLIGPSFLTSNYHPNNEEEFEIQLDPGENFTITNFIASRSTCEIQQTGPYKFKVRIPGSWSFYPPNHNQDYLRITVLDQSGACVKGISKTIIIYPNQGGGGGELPDPGGPQNPNFGL
ncbi:hypothetical protein [Parapedobacter tibetensis]|uniref:hypothetical protein n=1 Tax=Parapedobacter tibetensis TaxID=2972951 RepID=UPI00214DEE34|nr:hypothetical protein [Parapedobacter tibetensis]